MNSQPKHNLAIEGPIAIQNWTLPSHIEDAELQQSKRARITSC